MLFNLWARATYFFSDFSLYLALIVILLIILPPLSYKILKTNLSLTTKKLAVSAIFTLLLLVITYSAFEAYFRYVFDQSDGLGFLKTNARWHQRHVVTNNYFFRDRNFEPNKKEGRVRIGVLGDSITFGGGIENPKDRFSDLSEKSLKESGYNIEVYNLGKSGYDTEAEISEYEKVKHLDFDIIVLQYFLNDIQPANESTGTSIINKNSQQAKAIKLISDKSFFFDFVYWRLSSKYQQTFEELKNADLNQYQNNLVFENHKKQLESFIKNLKEEDKEIIVIIFPFTHLLGQNYPAQNVHNQLNDLFEKEEVEVVDLLDTLKGMEAKNLIASKFDSHPNESVHKLASQELSKRIDSLIVKLTSETSTLSP